MDNSLPTPIPKNKAYLEKNTNGVIKEPFYEKMNVGMT